MQGPRHRLSLTASSSRFSSAFLCSSTVLPNGQPGACPRPPRAGSRRAFCHKCPAAVWGEAGSPAAAHPRHPPHRHWKPAGQRVLPWVMSIFPNTFYIKNTSYKHYHITSYGEKNHLHFSYLQVSTNSDSCKALPVHYFSLYLSFISFTREGSLRIELEISWLETSPLTF